MVVLRDGRDPGWLSEIGWRMAAALTHRGPDDSGVWVSDDARVMLANARLAIRSLGPAGHQPAISPDGRVALTYNGELYRDRGAGLAGWPMRTACDTEQFLQLVHGTSDPAQALRDLDGMFAAAWYDRTTGVTRLARDHFGVKPLVFARVAGAVVFASEVGALFASALVPRRLDPLTMLHKTYVRMDAVDDRSWFDGVHVLEPATVMTIEGATTDVRQFWTPSVAERAVEAAEVRHAFAEAVRIRTTADVEKAAFVSGGLDSSAVFGQLVATGETVRPFVVRYEGGAAAQNDDLAFALDVARRWGAEAVVCDVRVDRLEGLVDCVVQRLGRPLLHGAELAMYCTYEQVAKDGIKVVYSGHGADEMWGYQDGRYFPIVSPGFRPDMHSEYYLRNLLYRDERPRWHRMVDRLAEVAGVKDGDITDLVWERTLAPYRSLPTLDPYKRGRYHLMRRFLGYVNDMVDAMSSAWSLEDRPVFQDVGLAELAFGMPEYRKNREGPSDFKPFLKKALRDLVPATVLARGKQGFPAPTVPAYRERLADLVRANPTPFGVPPPDLEVETMGVSELMFLLSASRWLKLNGLDG